MNKLKHYKKRIQEGKLQEMRREFAWIGTYAGKHIVGIVIYTAIGLAGTLVTLANSLISKDLVDIITGHQTGKLLLSFVMIIVASLLSGAITQISGYISTKISLKVEHDIKADMYDKLMATEWESLSKYHSGDIIMRWGGASQIANGILSTFPNLIISLFRFVSALWLVIQYDASFAIFALLSVPISIASSRMSMKRMQKSNMMGMGVNARMASFTQESFGNVQTVKAFDMVGTYSKQLRVLLSEIREVQMRYQRNSIYNSIILILVSMVVTYTTYGWGVYKVWSGAITYGTMTMFLGLSSTLSGTIQALVGMVPNTIMLSNTAKRAMEILELPKEDYTDDAEVERLQKIANNTGFTIRIENTAFTYANGTEVFDNINLCARPHEAIALVGPSGQGKTTMLRLFLALIHSQEGSSRIFVDDGYGFEQSIPITASTRKLFAYVPQGNTMFSGTIAENMRKVKEDATDEEIIEALKLGCAWEFVSKLPEGIDTPIQERGGGFSEGQAQRLSISRAILKRAPILLLDEATSALDIDTEKEVLANIMQDKYPRTTIVTTHRPSVLKSCNSIYRIKDKNCTLMTEEEIKELEAKYL